MALIFYHKVEWTASFGYCSSYRLYVITPPTQFAKKCEPRWCYATCKTQFFCFLTAKICWKFDSAWRQGRKSRYLFLTEHAKRNLWRSLHSVNSEFLEWKFESLGQSFFWVRFLKPTFHFWVSLSWSRVTLRKPDSIFQLLRLAPRPLCQLSWSKVPFLPIGHLQSGWLWLTHRWSRHLLF